MRWGEGPGVCSGVEVGGGGVLLYLLTSLCSLCVCSFSLPAESLPPASCSQYCSSASEMRLLLNCCAHHCVCSNFMQQLCMFLPSKLHTCTCAQTDLFIFFLLRETLPHFIHVVFLLLSFIHMGHMCHCCLFYNDSIDCTSK